MRRSVAHATTCKSRTGQDLERKSDWDSTEPTAVEEFTSTDAAAESLPVASPQPLADAALPVLDPLHDQR